MKANEPTISIEQAINKAKALLVESDSALLDARVLLSHVLSCSSTYLHTWSDKMLTADQLNHYFSLIAKRIEGLPVAHLTGRRDFWSLELLVNDSTLIPRPETELLVELALDLAVPADCKLIDLGTGTGAIALAIAKERPNWHILATDFDASILQLTAKNIAHNHIKNVSLLPSRWFDELPEQSFDVIVSNPPYIDPTDVHLTQGDVRFEPKSALIADNHGLADIQEIVTQAPHYLADGGWLLLEHGYDQRNAVQALLQDNGFHQVRTCQDLAGQDRVTLGQKTSTPH